MKCPDCIHYSLCKNENGCTDYYDPEFDEYTDGNVDMNCDHFMTVEMYWEEKDNENRH